VIKASGVQCETMTAADMVVVDLDGNVVAGDRRTSTDTPTHLADPAGAVEHAVTLEEVARIAVLTTVIEPAAAPLDAAVRQKHFGRKHGPQACYGQP
jgi:ribulose-5-phosphate 4-epimerase/fuculose-1-phosphate aldolase